MTAPARTTRLGLGTLALRQGASELKQFLRSREQVVFTMAFPVIMIIIFGSIFSGDLGNGVKFTQYFVTGMIASGFSGIGFNGFPAGWVARSHSVSRH